MFGECGLDSSGSGQRPLAGSCEHDNEPSGSMKDGDSWLAERTVYLLKNRPSSLALVS
jgi:hypothetical protein